MARRKAKSRSWRLYLLAAIALALLIAAGWYWWTMRGWTPPEEAYPEQGIALAPGQHDVRFETVRALGGQFAYFSIGAAGEPRDVGLRSAMESARKADLRMGTVLLFDPCLAADPQSAHFVTTVARDPAMMPPVIALSRGADECDEPVSDAAVESELMTLINQVEGHASKPVILKLSRAFEERHAVSASIARDLWVAGDRFAPRYASRPWLLWSANGSRHIEGADDPVEWIVVQP